MTRFWAERGRGRAVSVDDVLTKSPSDPDYLQTRASVITLIAGQAAVVSSEDEADASERATIATTIGVDAAEQCKAHGRLPQIDGYDLVSCLGRGGMGSVYEGYQRSTGRRVAVKLMHERMAGSNDARQRFEREVDVVARLQHPGIVSVIDSGVRTGQYFFVMEYVSGKPLDAALKPGSCGVREALELMVRVFDAVDYAHQRGVLHRDLKPSNIIIDGDGVPHLLDFGLAKVFDPASGDGGSHGAMGLTVSGPGQLLGTLAYMTSEQAEGKYDQTSVRTDVYSLAAITYELITGSLPTPMAESVAETLTRIISQPAAAPSSLRRGVGRDVDAVLLKALEKLPERRYATVGEFAADVRRYLAGEPVQARRVGPIGRTRRWIARNSAVSAVIFSAAAVLIVVSAVLVFRIVRERDEARDSLGRLLSVLESADPERTGGFTMVQLLDGTMKSLDESPPERDLAEAEIRGVIGGVYRKFMEYDKARSNQLKALAIRERHAGGDDPAVADAIHNLAATNWWDGRFAEAESLYLRSLEMRRRLYPGNHQSVAMSMTHLAACRLRMGKQAEARVLYQQALDMRRALYGGEHEEVAQSLNNLAKCSLDAGNFDQAENLFRQSLDMIRKLKGDAAAGTAAASQNLGDCLIRRGEADALAGDADSAREAGRGAREAFERALQIRTQMYPQGHHLIVGSLCGLAKAELLAEEVGGLIRARDLAERGLEMAAKTRRADHPEVCEALVILGSVQLAAGDAGATETLQRALALAEAARPPSKLYIARIQRDLAEALLKEGNAAGAEELLARALVEVRRLRGDDAPETRRTARRLLELYTARGDHSAADALRAIAQPSQE